MCIISSIFNDITAGKHHKTESCSINVCQVGLCSESMKVTQNMEGSHISKATHLLDAITLSGKVNWITNVICSHPYNSHFLTTSACSDGNTDNLKGKDTHPLRYLISCLCCQPRPDSHAKQYETTSWELVDHHCPSFICASNHAPVYISELQILQSKECFLLPLSSLLLSHIGQNTGLSLLCACKISNSLFELHRRTNASTVQEGTENSFGKNVTKCSEDRAGRINTQVRTKPSRSLSGSTCLSSFAVAYLLFFIFLASVPAPSFADQNKVSIHAIIPRHFGMTTELNREFSSTVLNFKRDIRNNRLRTFFSTEEVITFISEDTPREILDAFCKGVLAKRAVTILNINNPLGMKRRTSSNQYILEIANHLGIPVISWDTEFTGTSQVSTYIFFDCISG